MFDDNTIDLLSQWRGAVHFGSETNEATELIELKKENAQLREELAEMIKERDALLDDMKIGADCDTCKHQGEEDNEDILISSSCSTPLCNGCNWEWRGVK